MLRSAASTTSADSRPTTLSAWRYLAARMPGRFLTWVKCMMRCREGLCVVLAFTRATPSCRSGSGLLRRLPPGPLPQPIRSAHCQAAIWNQNKSSSVSRNRRRRRAGHSRQWILYPSGDGSRASSSGSPADPNEQPVPARQVIAADPEIPSSAPQRRASTPIPPVPEELNGIDQAIHRASIPHGPRRRAPIPRSRRHTARQGTWPQTKIPTKSPQHIRLTSTTRRPAVTHFHWSEAR